MSDSEKKEPKQYSIGIILVPLMIFGAGWYFFGGGLEKQADKNLNDIYKKVADESIQKYEIASRSGSAVDRCVAAGMVAAAQLQAKNEGAYSDWKAKESKDCKKAGVPR